MESLEYQLQHAWRERISQNIETCTSAVVQLRHKLQLPGPSVTLEGLKKSASLGHSARHVAEVALLMASLARTQGKLQNSETQVETVLEFIESESIDLPFQYYFQKGLNHWVSSKYSEAFEIFLSARLVAKTSLEEIYALCNALMCLESLGLPHDHIRQELSTCIEKTPPSDIPNDVLSQIKAWELRNYFRSGDLAPIFKTSWEDSTVSQVNYYKLWVQSLPFHKFHNKFSDADFEKFLISSPYSVQKAYRSRTLQGLLVEDDSYNFKVSEMADRLYLWVWKWLVTPDRMPLEKITVLLARSNLPKMCEHLAVDDYFFLRNSLLWLSFFDPASTVKLGNILSRLKFLQAKVPPLFDFEEMVILYLTALRNSDRHDAEKYLSALRAHPLWKSPDLLWSKVVTAISERKTTDELSSLKPLVTNLSNYIYPSRDQKHMVVNLSQMKIEFRDGSDLVSEPICRCLDLVHRKGSVEFSEILKSCFEIHHYDSYIHNPKVFNLVSRLKKILPDEIKLKTKNSRLYVSGSWRDVSFVFPSLPSEKLSTQSDWLNFLGQGEESRLEQEKNEGRDMKLKVAFGSLKNKSSFSREELQIACGFSRSTSNRILSEWFKKGLITKSGQAKNTVYMFTEKVSSL